MTYRKTWLSCVLWIPYAMLCIVSLVVLVGGVWSYYLADILYQKGYLPDVPYVKGMQDTIGSSLANLSDEGTMQLGLLILPLSAALYWMIRGISGKIRKKYVGEERGLGKWEAVVVFLTVAGGLLLRLAYAKFTLSLFDRGIIPIQQIRGIEYYNMAEVTTGSFMPGSLDPMSGLYVLCLSVVLSFLGNKIVSVVIFQALLQVSGMILAYAVTRKLAGRLPAWLMLIYLSCSVCCLKTLTHIGPEWLFFVLYMTVMLIGAGLAKSYCANQLSRPAAILGALVAGVLAGGLACVDLTAASLAVVAVAMVIGRKKYQDQAVRCNGVWMTVFVIFLMILAYMAVLFGIPYMKSSGGGFDLSQLSMWYEYDIGAIQQIPYAYDMYMFGLLIVPASFLIFEFFRRGKEDNYTVWLFLAVIAAPTPVTLLGTHGFGILSIYIWAVLGGLGLQNCIFGGKAQVMQAVIEEINATAEAVEKAAEETSEQIMPDVEAETEEAVQRTVPDAEAETEEAVQQTVSDAEAETVEPAKPRYIENPLPLPKKHVKKEMDYQYEVAESNMKYDVEVAQGDDFDLT